MKRRAATSRTRTGLAVVLAAVSLGAVTPARAGDTNAVIPLIVMDDVPLLDAIRNLARQAEINYIIDPQITSPWSAPAGSSTKATTTVTARWENLTAKEALKKVLDEHRLSTVENPKTTVTRITKSNEAPKTTPGILSGGGTNAAIPLVVFDDVPLGVALKQLADKAALEVGIDRRLSETSFLPDGKPVFAPTVSVRWRNVTPNQALTALMENYDLVVRTNVAGIEITANTPASEQSATQQNPAR